MVIATTQGVRHLKQVRQYCRWLKRLQGVLNHVWILGDDADEVLGVRFGEQGEVGGGDFGGCEVCSAGDGAETGVRVLEVGSCIAFEGCHGVHVEVIVVDPITFRQ